MTIREGERSVGELFNELAIETGTLVRQEVHLATTELTQKAAIAGRSSLRVIAGATLGFAAVMTLVAAFVVILAHAVPLWVSMLIVAAIVGAVAYWLARSGIRAVKNADLRPTETIASLKEDKTWTTNLVH
jgi:threonine/homoserine/homoserine lactone efflux protein